MFIKNIFRKQSKFEKRLLESSILDQQETVDLDHIKAMLQGYPSREEQEQLVQSMTIVQVFKEFLKYIPPTLDPHRKLKVLLTFHVLMGDVKHGRLFVAQLVQWNGWSCDKDDTKQHFMRFANVHTMIVQKLALINEIVSRSKLKTNIQLLFKDLEGSVFQFYKVINCLNFILAQYDLFQAVIKANNRVIVMEVYLLLWNDVIALYLLLERFIRQFLDCYQQIDSKQSIQIYELFIEYTKLTTEVHKFAELSALFKNCGIMEPKWFVPKKKELEELQLYFQNVKIYMTSRSKRNRIDKPNQQSQILGRLCQTTDRELRKNKSQSLAKTERKPSDMFVSLTTMGYVKKLSQASNHTQALQYTFESDHKDN